MADAIQKAPAKPAEKKKSDGVAVTITLPMDAYTWFEEKAKADERSVNKYIARELRRQFEREMNAKQTSYTAHGLNDHN